MNAHFEVHLYNFLTSRIPLPAYLLATLLLGWVLARWQSRPTLAAAGGVLIWLSIPLMGTERALLAFLFAPLTMLRFGRIALLHIWPAFAYRTYGLDMYGPLWSAKGLFLFDRLSGEGLIGTAISNAVLMGLVLWAVLAIRPLVPAQAQDRLGNLLPKFLRPLSTNQWLSGTGVGRRWDINLGLILFCLVPALLAGPLAVLYLRARASHLLWRSTWIVALWSTLRAAAEGAEWVWSRLYHTVVHNQPLFGPMQVYTALESQLGYWLPRLQVEALAGILFAVLCCATVPRARASRWSWAALALMLVFACCFLVIALRWLPAPAPGGVPTDLQMMQDFMTRELLKQKP